VKPRKVLFAPFVPLAAVLLFTGCTSPKDTAPEPAPVVQNEFTQPSPRLADLNEGHYTLMADDFMAVKLSDRSCWINKQAYITTPADRQRNPQTFRRSKLVQVTHGQHGYYVNGVGNEVKWLPWENNDQAGAPDYVPVRNCAALDQPSNGLKATDNRIQDKYRLPQVKYDLKTWGTGWIGDDVTRDSKPADTPDGGSLEINPAILIPSTRTNCRIDPGQRMVKHRDAQHTIQVRWDGQQYVIATPHFANASILQLWNKQLHEQDHFKTNHWQPAVCPAA
jgi:hypothetical protein